MCSIKMKPLCPGLNPSEAAFAKQVQNTLPLCRLSGDRKVFVAIYVTLSVCAQHQLKFDQPSLFQDKSFLSGFAFSQNWNIVNYKVFNAQAIAEKFTVDQDDGQGVKRTGI